MMDNAREKRHMFREQRIRSSIFYTAELLHGLTEGDVAISSPDYSTCSQPCLAIFLATAPEIQYAIRWPVFDPCLDSRVQFSRKMEPSVQALRVMLAQCLTKRLKSRPGTNRAARLLPTGCSER